MVRISDGMNSIRTTNHASRTMFVVSRFTLHCLVVGLVLAFHTNVWATSPQIELSEPLLDRPGLVHSTAFFGAVAGSKVYDTAGSLGTTFQLGKQKSGRFYFFGDIFTWIKNMSGTSFEPKRITYTLETGYAIENEGNRTRIFIKHQSFHNVDFVDGPRESYELYGVSYQWLKKPDIYLSVGNYLNKKNVDYTWDLVASATIDLKSIEGHDTYLHVWLHRVTESGNIRDGFTDYAGELGVHLSPAVTAFGRYELLNDIDHFKGTADHHTMIGIRYQW